MPRADFTQECVGVAGTLSGGRSHHATVFLSATAFLQGKGIPTLLADDGADPRRAVLMADEFARRGARLVIGHFSSLSAQAAIPRYRAHGIDLLLPAATDPAIRTGAGVYRLCANDAEQVATMVHWLRRRDGAGIEVRMDGSDYSRRLLGLLEAAAGGEIARVLDIGDPRSCGRPNVVVLALAPAATAFAAGGCLHQGVGAALFSDEAAVGKFAVAAASAAANCWVSCPAPSYELLLSSACQLAAEWWPRRAESFGDWIAESCYFRPSGEAVDAAWNVRLAADLLPVPATAPIRFH